MKILINRKPVNGPWGGGNLFLKSMYDYLPEYGCTLTNNLEENIDIIFLMNPRADEKNISINEAINYKFKNPNTAIVQRINDCDARKNTNDVDKMLLECSKYLDKTIFVSNWMQDYFLEKEWACKNNHILINGVSEFENFSHKIENNKINIVTHHWSNNYLKGFDIYDKLDRWVSENNDFTFTYIGRHRNSFKNTKLIEPIHGIELIRELSKYDVYVSASRHDPGPNHILESLNCNIPTYVHSDGGGAVEFAGSSHVYEDFEILKSILLKKSFVKNKNILYNWKTMIEKLYIILLKNRG